MNLFQDDSKASPIQRAPELTAEAFFKVAHLHSIIKSEIVSKYVIGWAKIIIAGRKRYNVNPSRQGPKQTEKAYFVDLFCGCGVYGDGTLSTPIKVINEVLAEENLCENLVLRFNDESDSMISKLQKNVEAVIGVNKIQNPIKYYCLDAESPTVAGWFKTNAATKRIPTVAFIDPFGYKQISQDLLRTIISLPQSDIIFFFNYKRVNAALGNEQFESNMDKMFGDLRVQRIKSELAKTKPADREALILGHLKESLLEVGANFVCSYLVVPEDEQQTSHYIVGMTKHEKGYDLMKKVMKQHSQIGLRAKSKFGHDLASMQRDKQQSMFDALPDPIADLAVQLYKDFAGRALLFSLLYKTHHPSTEYTESEYKQAIRLLIKQGKAATLEECKIVRGVLTIPDHITIRFLNS